MFKLLRFHHLAIVAGLFSATAACSKSDDTRKNAENAAEAVRDRTDDLKDEAKDLKETANDNAEELADKTKDNAEALKEDVKEVVADLKDRANDTADKAKDNVEDLKDETKDLTKEAVAARDALKEFEYQRLIRVQTLRGVHAIAASQLFLINSVASSEALVEADRSGVNEKLHLFQMRIDESAELVQELDGVDAANWTARERATSAALNRLEDAREDAWDTLDDAKRLDKTSMR